MVSRRKKRRMTTAESFYSVWDPDEEDPITARFRGVIFLCWWSLCLVLFIVGLIMPLVHVVVFTESEIEKSIEKSLLGIIHHKWKQGEHCSALLTGLCSVAVPIVTFVGMLAVISDNFFAKGWDLTGCLRAHQRNLIVEAMTTFCSYEVVCSFLTILVLCFFRNGATEIHCHVGFYSYILYCLLSTVMLQAL